MPDVAGAKYVQTLFTARISRLLELSSVLMMRMHEVSPITLLCRTESNQWMFADSGTFLGFLLNGFANEQPFEIK